MLSLYSLIISNKVFFLEIVELSLLSNLGIETIFAWKSSFAFSVSIISIISNKSNKLIFQLFIILNFENKIDGKLKLSSSKFSLIIICVLVLSIIILMVDSSS